MRAAEPAAQSYPPIDDGALADDVPTRKHSAADRLLARLDRRPSAREPRDVHFLRYLPRPTPLHGLWAGTKLLSILILSIVLFIWPSWRGVGLVGALLLAVLLAARIPAGALPRIPRWIYALLLVGALIALLSGGKPVVHLSGLSFGAGGIETWARFFVLALELLGMAALVGWTTPIAELAPALTTLASPLRRLRVPVDELAAALALSIRCLPLVVDELRTLRDARRARRPTRARSAEELLNDTIELAVASLLGAIRRAAELADAIEARGGVAVVRFGRQRLGSTDVVALLVVAAVGVAVGLIG